MSVSAEYKCSKFDGECKVKAIFFYVAGPAQRLPVIFSSTTVIVTVTEALVLRAHHRVNLYPGAHSQNETEMFSEHDETSPSIAAVSAPSAACYMLAVQQQFVDVFVARRGCHSTMKHAV